MKLNFLTAPCPARPCLNKPNTISLGSGLKLVLFVTLNHPTTWRVKDKVNWQSRKVWSMESDSPQYKQSLSLLIPYLFNSFLVTTIRWRSLNLNSLCLVSLHVLYDILKDYHHEALSIGSILFQRCKPAEVDWCSLKFKSR